MMKDMKVVFAFELCNKLKEKAVRITTLIILVIILIGTFIPTIISMFDNKVSERNTEQEIIEENKTEEYNAINITGNNEYGYSIVNNVIDREELKAFYPFNVAKYYFDEKELRKAVESGEIEKGILITSITSYILIANDLSMYDRSTSIISAELSRYNRNIILLEEGIDPVKVDKAESVHIQANTEILGKNATTGFLFAYVGMFLVYFIIILYGNSVATSVAREKNDRTMELLITNTSSKNLIWGKVLASTVVSIGQLLLMILTAGFGIALNQNNYPEFLIRAIQEGMSLGAIFVFIIFALFGTLMYYFLYASVGALVSKVEEVNSSMTPIQFVFIAAFLLCSISLNMPDSLLMKVISIVPFTSPMAMFIRYTMTTVPLTDLIVAIILLLITLYFMAYLAIRIYRMGTLNYGNKIGFFKAVKSVFRNAQ
ncbi:MAG TPA: ABC transporter permease [Clostridiaceae bacterium]|nr:ABC transporter permease [Clostridiaceae bacterium]